MRTERVRAEVLIAGGGTGGHVFPGLALAEELRRRQPGRQIGWIGARGGIEERLVPRAGIPLTLLTMSGLARTGSVDRVLALARAAIATLRLAARFSTRRPALVVGVGGFAAGPAVLAATMLRVPTLLLEQNAVAGVTNRSLSRFASAVAASFPESLPGLKGRVVVTGNPVRAEIAAIPERPSGPVRRVLAFGGSRGARPLNEAWALALPLLSGLPLAFTLQTGDADHALVAGAAREAGVEAEVLAFLDDMPARLAVADLVVARSGATTVAELTAAGRASILVPFPQAANDHQRANARALEARGAARVIEQRELTPERLASMVRGALEEPQTIDVMSRAARGCGVRDAAARVAALAEELAA